MLFRAYWSASAGLGRMPEAALQQVLTDGIDR
jgi:hypothetical protein